MPLNGNHPKPLIRYFHKAGINAQRPTKVNKNMDTIKWDIAVISVITSGVVAVASMLFPLIINFLLDSQKWSRERKAAEADKIEKAAAELLDVLADFRSGDVLRATNRSPQMVFSQLLSNYYTWERTMWLHCKKSEQPRLLELRKEFENGDPKSFLTSAPNLVNEILDLTYNIKKVI
jgi:hypothetical protein